MATGKERQKQLAREHHERQLQRRLEREARVKRTAIIGSSVGVVVVVGGIVAATTLLSGGNGDPQAAASATASASTSTSAEPTPSEPPQPTPTPIDLKTVSCAYTKSEQGKVKDVGLPPKKPNLKAQTMTIKTNQGNIVVDLMPKKAPCTVNSFDYLASKNYFDDTKCHRLVTPESGLAVLQCGDPLAKADGKEQGGNGGPGYVYADENLGGMKYTRGVVAMANAGAGTNGSQFFIVYGDETASLPPQYTPFGTVTKGMEIVDKVAKGGFLEDKTSPKVPVDIKDVTITGKS